MPLPKFVQCSWGRAVGANSLGNICFVPLSLEVLDCLRIWHQHTNKREGMSTFHGGVGCLAFIVFWAAPGEGCNSAIMVACPFSRTLLWLGNLKPLRCSLVRTGEVLWLDSLSWLSEHLAKERLLSLLFPRAFSLALTSCLSFRGFTH